MSRICKHPQCTHNVPFRYKEGGYCDKKYGAHWNPAESTWDRPKCECGADSLKSDANPAPAHSHWCPIYKWERE